jgi:penicillin amidase
LKTILISLLGLVIVIVIAALIVVTGIKRGALPKYSGEIVIPGLGSDVTVFRDDRGIPHIYAANEYDLYFSTGYIMAQERLWQMDLIRRATTGRLSEIFGESMVQTDLFLRSLDMTAKSKMILNGADSAIIECMKAYTDGVNANISSEGKNSRLNSEFSATSLTHGNLKI